MIGKEKLERINELARKQKNEGLNEEEKKEQALLRKAYLEAFRKQFRKQLDSIKIVDESDNREN